MLRSVLRFAPTAALFALTVATGHLAATYGNRISLARSAAAAAPYAAPFALFAVAAGASAALAGAAACDAAERSAR